jgi:hypothetical protein
MVMKTLLKIKSVRRSKPPPLEPSECEECKTLRAELERYKKIFSDFKEGYKKGIIDDRRIMDAIKAEAGIE